MDQAVDDLREEIESIDCGLLRLWEKRMYTAVKMGVYKRNNGLDIYDSEREKQLWFNWQQQLDEDNADLAALIFQANTAAARLRQSQICGKRQPNIYLIGHSGCPKAEAGLIAARRLNRGFCDMEQLLCTAYGCTLELMREQGGEDVLRSRETALLAALASQPGGLIVSTEAGILSSPLNASLMRASGAMIWVRYPEAGSDAAEPPVSDQVYRSAAAAEVSGSTAEELAGQIADILE